jgi:hypothetical protein
MYFFFGCASTFLYKGPIIRFKKENSFLIKKNYLNIVFQTIIVNYI